MAGKIASEQYPVFVYGSLMSGLHNAGLLHPSVDLLSPGWVRGFSLFSMRDVYPYAVEGESTADVVVGEICWVMSMQYERVLDRLDRLEGVDSGHYERGLVLVTPDDGSPDMLAWMFTASPEVASYVRATMPDVEDGDWRLYLSQVSVSQDEAGAGGLVSTWLDEQPEDDVTAAIERMQTRRPGYVDEVAHGDVRFAVWLSLVDRRLIRLVGLSHRDLSDWLWTDAFESGMSPRDAAMEALEADDIGAQMLAALTDAGEEA